jgi:serine/threonine-protein kinase
MARILWRRAFQNGRNVKTLKLPHGDWQYDANQMLGRKGGFASVYSGLSSDGQPVAVKIFHPSKKDEAKRELEFAAAQIGKAASHIIEIFDSGIDVATGEPAIVMSKGDMSLADHISSAAPLNEQQACDIAVQIARGLIEAGGWVHRDLKPPNVIRCSGSWRVSDFGIARVASAATAPDTMKFYWSMAYAAPEQWNAERATRATDVYALGCILHELLTASPLFSGPTYEDFARQHRFEPPSIFAGSAKLQSLLTIMLSKAAEVRPAVDDVAARLAALANPTVSKDAASPLARASASLLQEEARRHAASQRDRHIQNKRQVIRDHALAVLRDIRDRLFARIKEDAPTARISSPGPAAKVAELGVATLTMSVGHMKDVPREAFAISGWDVICWDFIKVEQPGYSRGASLWYVNDGSGAWRWLEVAYFAWAGSGNPGGEPCFLPPKRDADLAASKTIHSWQFAHEPRPVEADHTDAFLDRWIHFFAAASERRLTRPSTLPEGS